MGETPDVVCLGETMGQFTTGDGSPVELADRFALSAAGAESNVAISLAQLAHRVAWVSRLGADAVGRRILTSVAAAGVDVTGVTVDDDHRTGVFIKDPHPAGSTVTYYRDGSAASTMTPADVRRALELRPRILHSTGVTAALSATCRAAADAAVDDARGAGILSSFDVNYRPALWASNETAARELRTLANRADIVFVGLDEATALWGSASARDVRALLPGPAHLVVKDGAADAAEFHPDGLQVELARAVDVVEPVGAGDAFASGWLHGWLAGDSPSHRLRWGHLIAARALTSRQDHSSEPVRHQELVQALTASWPAIRDVDPASGA